MVMWLHHKAPINDPNWTFEQSSINGAHIDLTLSFMSEINYLIKKDIHIAIFFYRILTNIKIGVKYDLPPRIQEIVG